MTDEKLISLVASLAVERRKTEKMFRETSRQMKETKQQIKETGLQIKETDRQMKETDKRIEKRFKRLDEQLGYYGRSLGDVVELILVPGICEKMNACGHNFTKIGPNKILDRENKRTLTEIDLLLENGEESMAVEIKTDLSVKWVNKHLERLKLLRKHENITGLRGKTLYGAAAGISIDSEARDLALENGMYVIRMIEDEERLEVFVPPRGYIGRW
ncbi:MAG: hypothetical protein LBQ76_00280 [Candidatus Fibromonas sp.]|jgi:septal ring factor EnvC (AmiA/AmiB activator)|nr:hypothetical protein [Candidatus Fibromonas sp.]